MGPRCWRKLVTDLNQLMFPLNCRFFVGFHIKGIWRNWNLLYYLDKMLRYLVCRYITPICHRYNGYQKFNTNLLHYTSLLLLFNSPTCFDLTCWPSLGSLVWHMQRMFQLIYWNYNKLLNCCVYNSKIANVKYG